MSLTPEEREAGRLYRQAKGRERKAAKRERPKKPKARRGSDVDNVYRAWIRRQLCAVGPVGCQGPVQAAHVRTHRPGERPTGMQRKPPDHRNLNPLCAKHHAEQHDAGNELRWWAGFGKHPHTEAESSYAKFLKEGEVP